MRTTPILSKSFRVWKAFNCGVTPGQPTYLFSIDLEDVRDMIPDGHQYREGVVNNTIKYLDWLDGIDMKCTFFIVGKTAQAFPDLIREIIKRGHEAAAHTHNHIHLTKMSEHEFVKDLEQNIEALTSCGASKVTGFRAPTFSLVKSSQWVYKILKGFGFKYSSSVIPSANPIFGWQDFGGERMIDGIYEIPMNIGGSLFKVPFGGGVYFRTLPLPVLKRLFKNAAAKNQPVLGYFHPYDINTDQEHFMHPHLSENRLLNELMYINRSRVFKRLDAILDTGFTIIPYEEYFKKKVHSAK